MDRTHRGSSTTANPVAQRPQPRSIGFVGKTNITDYQAAILTYIGRCIAALGHTLVIVPAKGSATALREGVELQGGKVRTLEAGVLEVADRTLLYPDPPLLARLEHTYKDLRARHDVAIIEDDNALDGWLIAMKRILTKFGIDLPG